jgi:hypothetical protein
LRNIFDQYVQPENRVTHALITALDEDRWLLDRFLKELLRVKPPRSARHLGMLEQQYPGAPELSEEESERRGIPDAWIFDEGAGWCVFIETKVLAKLTVAQLLSHKRSAEGRGFRKVMAVAIAPRVPSASLPSDVVLLEWRTIYAWLRRHSRRSAWALCVAEYLEIAEAKLIDSEQFVEGTLTMFSGIPFGHEHPYTYLEGKRILELAMSELRGRRDLQKRLGMNPAVPGRPAITGRQGDLVWDFLSLSAARDASNFTRYPHLTLGITSQAVEAMVTVPNAINTAARRNIRSLGEDGFQSLTEEVVKNLRALLRAHKGATPWFRGVQRRYLSQRATPLLDARIDFDLRTAVQRGGPPKSQPRWLSAAYGSFVQKLGTNYQIQMGVLFRYDRCAELAAPNALKMVTEAWLGCKPLIDLCRVKR